MTATFLRDLDLLRVPSLLEVKEALLDTFAVHRMTADSTVRLRHKVLVKAGAEQVDRTMAHVHTALRGHGDMW